MKFKTLSMIAAMAATASVMAGCGDTPEPYNRIDAPNTPSFAVVTERATGETTLDSDVKCTVSYETYGKTVNFIVSDVNVPGSQRPVSFETGQQACKTGNDGGLSFTIEGMTVPGGEIGKLVFTGWPRMNSMNTLYSMYNAQFSLDDKWLVRVVDNACRWLGNTTVVTAGAAEDYKTVQPEYVVKFAPEKGTADLYIYNARFASNMPQAFNMIFKDIPFTINQQGYVLDIAELIPNIGEKPYERFVITDLHADGSFADNTLRVNFTCAGIYGVTAVLGPTIKVER